MPLHNSLSNSLKYDTWLLRAISFTIPYQNHWNITYDCNGQFPLQFRIQIDEISLMTARGHFLYNSLSKSLKDDLWLLGTISFTIPYQMIDMGPMTVKGHFLYNSLSKSLKYGLWLLGAICATIPYQNHRNMTYDSYEPFHFHYNSLSKSLKYNPWLLWSISFTIPY